MISGRGTKIIVSARGAYLAGNLRALIGHMTDDQQQRLRDTIWQEAVAVLRAVLRVHKLDHAGLHPALNVLDRYAAGSATEEDRRALTFFFNAGQLVPDLHGLAASPEQPVDDEFLRHCIGAVVKNLIDITRLQIVDLLSEPTEEIQPDGRRIITIRVKGIYGVVDAARRTVPHAGLALSYWWLVCSDLETQKITWNWQIEAAWAILRGTSIPSLEVVHDNGR